MSETGGSFVEPRGGTEPLQPVPERAFAPVFPYRGIEQHGVPVDAKPWIPTDADAQSWEGEEVYDPEYVPIQPIPVVVVNDNEREVRSWRTAVHSVTNRPAMIVGQNERMMRVRLRNMASAADMRVWISHESSVGPLNGWPLNANDVLEINTEEEIYAILDGAAVTAGYSDVAIIIEHRVG